MASIVKKATPRKRNSTTLKKNIKSYTSRAGAESSSAKGREASLLKKKGATLRKNIKSHTSRASAKSSKLRVKFFITVIKT